MPVVLVHEGMTQKQYEESVRRLTGSDERLSSPSQWPVEGLLTHVTGEGESGFRVVDVWESRDAVDRFGAQLIPILDEIGVQQRPEIYETHTFVSA
jgi:hypothetical protein